MNCASANATDLVEYANTGASVPTGAAKRVAHNCSALWDNCCIREPPKFPYPYWITEKWVINNFALQFLPYNTPFIQQVSYYFMRTVSRNYNREQPRHSFLYKMPEQISISKPFNFIFFFNFTDRCWLQ